MIFRPPNAADFTVLAEMRRDVGMQAMLMAIPEAVDDRAIEEWIARRTRDEGGLFHVIAEGDADNAVGFIQVGQVDRHNRVGYGAIAVSNRARLPGIGLVAMRELMRAACCDLGLVKLMAEIRVDNLTAIRMNLMSGYSVVGTLLSHFVDADGKRHDVLLLERHLEPGKFKRSLARKQ